MISHNKKFRGSYSRAESAAQRYVYWPAFLSAFSHVISRQRLCLQTSSANFIGKSWLFIHRDLSLHLFDKVMCPISNTSQWFLPKWPSYISPQKSDLTLFGTTLRGIGKRKSDSNILNFYSKTLCPRILKLSKDFKGYLN